MSRRQWDESDVRIRPSRRGTRPRTKDRPAHDDAEFGMVVTKDRGRWGVVLDGREDPIVTMRAREMGRTAVEVGDRVGVVGDTSGREGTCGAPPTTPTPTNGSSSPTRNSSSSSPLSPIPHPDPVSSNAPSSPPSSATSSRSCA